MMIYNGIVYWYVRQPDGSGPIRVVFFQDAIREEYWNRDTVKEYHKGCYWMVLE